VAFDTSLIFVFIAVGLAFVFFALFIGSFFRPKRMQPDARNTTYECGEVPEGQAWYNFNPRFYMLALVFLIFDVEVVVTFPAIVVLRRWAERGSGFAAYLEVLLFVVILMTGLVFLWIRGDLEWMKQIGSSGFGGDE
jgi:NADH-quinone oxidoreductase subunit A